MIRRVEQMPQFVFELALIVSRLTTLRIQDQATSIVVPGMNLKINQC